MRIITLLALLCVTGSVAWGATPESKDALVKRARKLFDAKSFAQACMLYAEVTKLAPREAPAWADLGLCELRNKRTSESIAASNMAVELGELAVRKQAYFNLGLAGARIALKEVREHRVRTESSGDEQVSCGQIVATIHGALSQPLVGCLWSFDGGSGSGVSAVSGALTILSDLQLPAQVKGDASAKPGEARELSCSSSAEERCTHCLIHNEDDEDARDACFANCGEHSRQTCTVVAIDAKRARAGVVCRVVDEKPNAKPVAKTVVSEVEWDTAAPANDSMRPLFKCQAY